MQEQKLFVIEEDLVIGLMQYLGTRPYAEVAIAMQRLPNLKVFSPSTDNKKKETKSQSGQDTKDN